MEHSHVQAQLSHLELGRHRPVYRLESHMLTIDVVKVTSRVLCRILALIAILHTLCKSKHSLVEIIQAGQLHLLQGHGTHGVEHTAPAAFFVCISCQVI